jgi:hypothetical protein
MPGYKKSGEMVFLLKQIKVTSINRQIVTYKNQQWKEKKKRSIFIWDMNICNGQPDRDGDPTIFVAMTLA